MIVTTLTAYQEAQIPIFIAKWSRWELATEAVDVEAVKDGLVMVCREIGIPEPKVALYYPSPIAMMRDFASWKSKVTCVSTQYWSYQIPLCDTGSMYRMWRPGNTRPAFNFCATRYSPGISYALCEREGSSEQRGTLIDSGFHHSLWQKFQLPVAFDWRLLGFYSFPEGGEIDNFLDERHYEEDPTSQIHVQEMCFLGPEKWLLKELACVDFCHQVLGINRNQPLYQGLEMIVENGSFMGTFGELLIVCERPVHIVATGTENHQWFELTFPDGENFNWHNTDFGRHHTLSNGP